MDFPQSQQENQYKKERMEIKMNSKDSNNVLPCGCIIGIFECPEYQRINTLQKDAYYRSDWEEYEKYRRMSWAHIKMKAPSFD